MQTFIDIDQIQSRAEAIGSSLSEIAVEAGLSPSTALRIAKRKTASGWHSTREKLAHALVAKEERMREHLATLAAETKAAPDKAA